MRLILKDSKENCSQYWSLSAFKVFDSALIELTNFRSLRTSNANLYIKRIMFIVSHQRSNANAKSLIEERRQWKIFSKESLIARRTSAKESSIEFTKISLTSSSIYISKKFSTLNLGSESKSFLTIGARSIFFAKLLNFFASISKTRRILFAF